MVDYFPPRTLPGEDQKTTPTDIATWEQIWETAETLYKRCVVGQNMAGWERVGKLPSREPR